MIVSDPKEKRKNMDQKEQPTMCTIVNLPKLTLEQYAQEDALVRQLAEKTRGLRLFALKTAPEAFGSSYEVEMQKGLDTTVERLKTPQASHFFAIEGSLDPWTAETDATYFQRLLQATWVGMIVLIGPLTSSGSLAISSKRDPMPLYSRAQADAATPVRETQEPLHYHVNGVFVDPKHRRAGLGRRLFEAALGRASAEASNRGQQMHCTILVDDDNPPAYKLYEEMGFRATGKESYIQQPRLQLGELKAEERVAVKMELTKL